MGPYFTCYSRAEALVEPRDAGVSYDAPEGLERRRVKAIG